MKRILFLLVLLCLEKVLHAQTPYIYTIKADSVKITNTCDTAELIIENHTQNVRGFLFNKGKGRTEFRRAVKLNDSTLVMGNDTLIIVGSTIANNGLSITERHVQLGQPVGATGNPAALGANREIPLNAKNLMFTGNGKLGIGTTSPGAKLEVTTTSGDPVFRISNGTYKTDFIQNGYVTTIGASSHLRLTWGSNVQNLFYLEDGPHYSGRLYISGHYGAFVNGFGGFSVGDNERFGFYTHGTTTRYNAIGTVLVDVYNRGLTFFVKRDSIESELVRFTYTGKVGIGTTSPLDKLHISGTVRITDTLKMPNIISKSDTSIYKPVVADAGGNIFKIGGWPFTASPALTVNNGSTSDISAAVGTLTKLPDLTGAGSHSVILPPASNYAGQKIYIWNRNNSANSWTFSSSITLPNNTTTNSIPNQSTIELISDGAVWLKWN